VHRSVQADEMMAAIKPFEGGCLCGAVRYRASSAPIRGVICHCPMCRKHSGAPALAFVHFRVGDFEWISGAPTRYQSSEFAQRGFCARCGSTLSMHEEVLADRVQVTVKPRRTGARAHRRSRLVRGTHPVVRNRRRSAALSAQQFRRGDEGSGYAAFNARPRRSMSAFSFAYCSRSHRA